MNNVELHYRKVTLSERLRQIESELMVLTEESEKVGAWANAAAFRLSRIHVASAADELDSCSPASLERLLEKSIAMIQERKAAGLELVPVSPERMRREQL